MKIKRVKPRSKRVASALQFAGLTNEQAQRIYANLFADFARDLNRPKLIVIEGGKK